MEVTDNEVIFSVKIKEIWSWFLKLIHKIMAKTINSHKL